MAGKSRTIYWSGVSDPKSVLSISMSRNQPLKFTLTMHSKPTLVIGDTFQATVVCSGFTWKSPMLVVVDDSYSSAKKWVLTGTDYSRYLLRENYTHASYVSTKSTKWTIKTIIEDIFSNLGLKYNIQGMGDGALFPIRQLDVEGEKPLDIIQKLLAIPVLDWYWRGDVFMTKLRNFNSAVIGGAYTFTAGVNYKSFKRGGSLENLKNVLEFKRAIRNDWVLEVERSGIDIFGQRVEEFDACFGATPFFVRVAFAEIRNTLGEFKFRRKSDGVFQPTNAGLCDAMSFFVDTQTPGTPGTPYYKLRIYGITGADDPEFESADERKKASIKKTDAGSVAQYGSMPGPAASINPLFTTFSMMETHAIRQLEETTKPFTADLDLPITPHLEVGDVVRVTEPFDQVNHRIFLESVTHNLSPGSYSTGIGGKFYV